jgi:hypothetical protein
MLRRQQLFLLNVVWGVVNTLISIAGLYFVFRYAVTVLATDEYTRELLLGEWVASVVGNTATAVLVAVSLYMGFKVVLLIISVATWENWFETEYRAIKRDQARERK